MANIQTFLKNILSSRYGKDVRQSIHDAIEEIDKVADTAQGSATEAAEIATTKAAQAAEHESNAEQYRNEAEQFRNESFAGTPEGYSELVENVAENTAKIDTIIEKADLGIKETASGEELHLIDSAEGKAVEFALYGKATQDGTPTPANPVEIEVSGASGSVEVKSLGKNLLSYPFTETTFTKNGITFTENNGIITANGTATSDVNFQLKARTIAKYILQKGKYTLSGCPSGGANNKYLIGVNYTNSSGTGVGLGSDFGSGFNFTIEEDTLSESCYIGVFITIRSGVKVENLVFKPMIRLATDTDDTWQPYKETLSTIPTPNGLAGIKVSSNGNYTDQNGQQWICDEVVKYADGSGAYIQRVAKRVYDGVKNVCGYVNASSVGATETLVQVNLGNAVHWTDSSVAQLNSICDKATYFVNTDVASKHRYHIQRDANSGIAVMYLSLEDGVTDIATANTWLQENNVTVYYILKEPITTPLTAEQFAEISTFYPITNISNDFDCGMSITYNADSKNYIDKNLALQRQAQEAAMMNMFLLLPEETQAAMIENDTNNLLAESEE